MAFSISPADDFHLHLRDEPILSSLVSAVAKRFRRCLIMPNLVPPIVTTEQALAYRGRILNALENARKQSPTGFVGFIPLMSLYLTDYTSPEEIKKAKASGHIYAVKLYPAGATTNSHAGVTDIKKLYPTLNAMAECGMPLLIHGEVTDQTIDIFDREKVFIDRHLRPLIKNVPNLKIVMEHITTKDAVDFILSCPKNVAATITAHHLLYNRNALFQGGLCPHFYCLPILKTEQDRKALVEAATSGNPKFFLGTDSAPHPQTKKESSCCSAGCYTSFAALELYTEVFELTNKLQHFENFACRYGAKFYGLPLNEEETKDRITLIPRSWEVPAFF